MAFLFRLGFAVIMLVTYALILWGLIVLINRGVQFIAGKLGYEVGDFFGWIASKFKRKKGKRKMKSPPADSDK